MFIIEDIIEISHVSQGYFTTTFYLLFNLNINYCFTNLIFRGRVMEFSISTNELSKGLYRSQGIVEKKTTMPVLSNVLITALSDEKITITATDLEVGVTGKHPANVAQTGSISVSARHIYDIVRSLPKDTLTIKKLDNNWALITCDKIEYRMMGIPPEEFHDLPEVSDANLFSVDPAVLKNMIDKTVYAVSNDETRYNLNGSFLENIEKEHFRMVATDGHRLSMIDAGLAQDPGKVVFNKGVIIPKKGLMEMKRLIEAEGGDCFLGIHENNMVFKNNDVLVVMRLLDGQFPEYRQVVPDDQKVVLKLNRKHFIDSLKRISIFASDRTMAIKLSLENGVIKISTTNPDLGDAQEEIVIDYEGKSFNIAFNARYLLDALGSIQTDIIEFNLEDDLSPGVIKPSDELGYKCVVMPMRI